MDLAPAVPPAQSYAPVVTLSATDFPETEFSSGDDYSVDTPSTPVLLSKSSSEPAVTIDPAVSTAPALLPAALTSGLPSLESLSIPSGSLISAQLTRSFNFVGQAFRDARLVSATNRPQYSAAVPIQWARSNQSSSSWKSWASTAQIQVAVVEATPQTAVIENNAWAATTASQCMPDARRELTSGVRYRLSLGDKTLGYVADKDRAYLLAQQLKRLVRAAEFDVNAIAPYPNHSSKETSPTKNWMVGTTHQALFSIDESMAEAVGYSKEWAAVAWANNLRLALEAEPLTTGEAQMTLKNMEPSELSIEGDASWYGPYFHGRATANGETYNQYDLTVAHKSLPFGTHLKIRNLTNDKTVVVRVNDRGPYVGDRSLDLSRAAADCLGSDDAGVVPYEAVVLKSVKRR